MKNDYCLLHGFAVVFVNSKYGLSLITIDAEDVKLFEGRTIYMRNKKYACVTVDGKQIALHRFITECPAEKVVDHINGLTHDNRRVNLRVVTQQENLRNGNKKKEHAGVKNVYLHKPTGRWQVKFTKDYRTINFGYYDTFEEAEKVANEKRKELYS